LTDPVADAVQAIELALAVDAGYAEGHCARAIVAALSEDDDAAATSHRGECAALGAGGALLDATDAAIDTGAFDLAVFAAADSPG
ncbi:MAG TPA: hypothetical protein PLV68_10290, partial [Ilumatobacteraceae bacterium]|nr:hypothetical protein [Ilumatobacteraceae bacterium]